ncbi:MAG: hypothetical protein F6J98_07905 [Moorea sp. SIO4G2]|uniref:hypothetical protein n=1 Tax=unclassified Moorena TaxID=2683338 RepID=UPI0013F6FA02|nr:MULTISPECIES: hypothetical protein [unclassified Moorena]NEO15155.1 hypothetical protein [Moorena sp. SIO3E8]NEO60352.1 hypothetical protein [Moorena sp. SIO4G2]NEQ01231.1 hypothetical protein [Moorena sp. SIO3F7]
MRPRSRQRRLAVGHATRTHNFIHSKLKVKIEYRSDCRTICLVGMSIEQDT